MGIWKANGSYSGSIRCVLGAYWQFGSAFGSSKIFVCMFKIFSSTFRMWRSCLFWKYSGSILRAYGMYGKRSGSMRLVLSAFGMKFEHWIRMLSEHTGMVIEHDECFPIVSIILSVISVFFQNIFRTARTLPVCHSLLSEHTK